MSEQNTQKNQENSSEETVEVLDDEKQYLIPHKYDGIQELDSPIPLWLNLILVGSVIFSLIYLPYYHGFGPGKSAKQDYEEEIAVANAAKEKARAEMGQIDLAALAKDTAAVAEGKSAYDTHCFACHGASMEGGIGPSLVDSEWRNGDGSPDSVYAIIANGIAAKGMPAWESNLGIGTVQKLTAFVLSVHGTQAGAAPTAAPAPDTDSETDSVDSASADGAALFAQHCAACHKPDGTGLVGPNLTDAEWISGDGSLESIATTISEGVLEKGMPAWKGVIGDEGVAATAEFVRSLQQ